MPEDKRQTRTFYINLLHYWLYIYLASVTC